MPRFAENTTVSAEKTQGEIKRMLMKAGATQYLTRDTPTSAAVAFEIKDRHIRFELPMPKYTDWAVTHTPQGKMRTQAQTDAAVEQVVRTRWRALHLCIKSKLEAVEIGITSFEEEFLAHIITPNGQTFGQRFIPELSTMAPGPLLLK